MLTTISYSVLLFVYWLVLRNSKTREPTRSDRQIEGEEAFKRLANGLGLLWLVSFALPYIVSPLKILDPVVSVGVGVALFGLGLGIRSLAMRTLGDFFTLALTIRPNHRLIQTGLYRWIRHPGYTGTILQIVGMMVAARSWAGLLGFMASGGVVIGLRIYREERMLQQVFGKEYEVYARSTKRLIPWIF